MITNTQQDWENVQCCESGSGTFPGSEIIFFIRIRQEWKSSSIKILFLMLGLWVSRRRDQKKFSEILVLIKIVFLVLIDCKAFLIISKYA